MKDIDSFTCSTATALFDTAIATAVSGSVLLLLRFYLFLLVLHDTVQTPVTEILDEFEDI